MPAQVIVVSGACFEMALVSLFFGVSDTLVGSPDEVTGALRPWWTGMEGRTSGCLQVGGEAVMQAEVATRQCGRARVTAEVSFQPADHTRAATATVPSQFSLHCPASAVPLCDMWALP